MTQSLTSRFKVLETLGRGTYGITQKIECRQESCYYVMKTYELPANKHTFDDLFREVAKVKEITHSNVTRCIHGFQLPSPERNLLRFSIQFEFVEQGNMEAFIGNREGRSFRSKTIQSWMSQLSSAIAFLHDGNLVHGNINLTNVLVDGNGNLKLSDVWLPRKVAYWTGTKTENSGFDAPETKTGSYYFESDIYSLGCVFVCMVTLQTHPVQANGRFHPLPSNVTYGREKMILVRQCLEYEQSLRPTANNMYISVKDDNYESLCFSSVHGYNIRLSEDRLLAWRTDDSLPSDGIIFSSRPIKPEERFCIRILETRDRDWPDIVFGFTSSNPDHLQGDVPSTLTEFQKLHKVWFKIKQVQNAIGSYLIFWFDKTGHVKYVLNEQVHVSSYVIDTTLKLWAIIHVYKGILKVQLTDYE